MRKLYIARHGETDYNAQNRYAGTIDIPLNEKGINQSQKLAQLLVGYPIDAIVSSPKKRAYQTAEIIKMYIPKPLFVKDTLYERNLGIFEGLTRGEVLSRYPELYKKDVLHQPDNREHEGESVNDVTQRAVKAMDEVLNDYEGNILLVTHGYIARMLHGHILGIKGPELNRFLLDNCQVVEYNVK